MLETIAAGIAEALSGAGIKAVTAFTADELDTSAPFVCVGLKSAKLSSSGLGNYIGICTEAGQVREMYGEKAELSLALDVYSPAAAEEKCLSFADLVRCALYGADGVSVTEFSFGEIKYDTESRMLLLRCPAKAFVYLVREKLGSSLSEYSIGEDA